MELKFLDMGQNLNPFQKGMDVAGILNWRHDQSLDVWNKIEQFNEECLHET
jgi:hypothetical protein